MNEFDDIRPYEAGEMEQAFGELLGDRHFNAVIKGYVPWLPQGVRNGLLKLAFWGVKTPLDFQKRFMKPVVKYVIKKHTDGCTFDDAALPTDRSQRYTFVSNHRDIVLDSALLDVMLIEHGYETTVEIGIGNNLLIYPWIERLVRMNKAFVVRRGLSLRETLEASRHMSRYIHHAVTVKRENIWIAQREGRAKDSSDHTQEAVLKMLAMGGVERKEERGERKEESFEVISSLKELNIVPLTISYEYDPCDYLKAQEMQQKRDNPAFKKSKQDDLDNMRTGIQGYKGRVHYQCAAPVNEWIDELAALPRQTLCAELASRMDRAIHSSYRLYPCNYIALDLLTGGHAQAVHYSDADRRRFEDYLEQQLSKISLPQKDEPFLRQQMLTMYANPLRNYLSTQA